MCIGGGGTGAAEEMEGGGSWGQGPAKLKWTVGPGAGSRNLEGKWTLSLRTDRREFALEGNAKSYGSMCTHLPIPQASILFPLVNHHHHSAETSTRHNG